MISNYQLMMFSTFMVMGVTMSLCSNNWVSIWLGLEVSLMMIIPMMTCKFKLSSESCLKYFIVQSLSSSIMMMGVIMISMNFYYFNVILASSMIIKLGMVPFHSWVLSVIEGLSFYTIFLILTIMKIGPMNLLFYMSLNLNVFVYLGLMVGATSGLNQNSTSKVMGYSSIFNISICMSAINQISVWSTFMLMYTIMSLMLISMLNFNNLNYINQIIFNNYNFSLKMTSWMILISIGGMPPMPMFISKLMIFENLFMCNNLFMLSMLILTSLLTMFFYMRLSIMTMTLYSTMSKWLMFSNTNTFSLIFMYILILSNWFMLLKILN